MDDISSEFNYKSDYSDTRTIKITASNSTGNEEILNNLEEINTDILVRNAMDIYLKKHKLDLTLLPNKKIKLSDLTQVSTSTLSEVKTSTYSKNSDKSQDENSLSLNKLDDDCGFEEVEDEDLDTSFETDYIVLENTNFSVSEKRSRKKREPSLKLQQKLNNADLELIVNCVCKSNARISIADVKKDNYVDKILKVELLDTNTVLSNGKTEAYLKKSMFPKELNTLFETFVNALCGQKHLVDENGNIKPTLTCLVVDCDYKSFSEAEIVRHIKRHLAQDGYTCSICSHQFASMTNLQRHLRIHEGNVGKLLKCPECDYKASTITHVKRHMAHKHLERALPCPHCSFMGATNAELKIHMARKHLELTGKNPLFLPKYLRKHYQCSICKEQYNDFKEYQSHMYEHTSGSNRFQCTECPYNCKNYSKLKRHMLYHTGARNYSCELCGNKFFQMEHLKRHMLSIHNIITTFFTPTAVSTLPVERIKRLPKSNQKANKQKRGSSQSEKLDSCHDQLFSQGSVVTTISIEADSSSGYNQLQYFKIISRCMFKCMLCEFSSPKLLKLNEHFLDNHTIGNFQKNFQMVNSDSFSSNELSLNEFEIDSNQSSDDSKDTEDRAYNGENLLNEQVLNEYYSCAFCSYRASKKIFLKTHLNNKHSSHIDHSIFLYNEPIITNVDARFQCGKCKSFLTNINEYIKHMNEMHSIQVFISDMNGNTSIREQLQTKGIAEIISTSTKIKPASVNTQPLNTSASQRQQLRNFINSSNIQARHQNHQHTTVRINPLIFKRQNIQQPIQKEQESNQSKQSNISSNQQKNEFSGNFTNHHKMIQKSDSNIIGICDSNQNYPNDIEQLVFRDAANQLDIIVNDFQ